jgi:DHA1 family bicyclomycin/chloramphenicol resistance-like MFS transporter
MIPVIAPSIGSLIIRVSTGARHIWPAHYHRHTGLYFYPLLKETNQEYSSESSFKTTLRLFVVLKNPHFYRLLIVFSIVSIPLLAFIGVSSLSLFTLRSECRRYSIYFGAIAAHYIFGGPIYLFLRRYFRQFPLLRKLLGVNLKRHPDTYNR